LDRKLTFGYNCKTNLWNQTNSIVLNGKKPLITNNIISCRNLFCMSWSFGKGLKEEKKPNIKLGATCCHLVVGSQSWWDQRWATIFSLNYLSKEAWSCSTCFVMVDMPLHLL
jgi:hypothetical protein